MFCRQSVYPCAPAITMVWNIKFSIFKTSKWQLKWWFPAYFSFHGLLHVFFFDCNQRQKAAKRKSIRVNRIRRKKCDYFVDKWHDKHSSMYQAIFARVCFFRCLSHACLHPFSHSILRGKTVGSFIFIALLFLTHSTHTRYIVIVCNGSSYAYIH